MDKYDEKDDDYDCPPGIGFHNGVVGGTQFTTLLHICLFDENFVFFNFHYPKRKKILGFIKINSDEVFWKTDFPIKDVENLIELFFESKFEEILKL